MEEFVRVIPEDEFKKKLDGLSRLLTEQKKGGFSRHLRLQFLISYVTVPVDRAFTPGQLGRIFGLIEKEYP